MSGTAFALIAGGLIVTVLLFRAFRIGRDGARSAAQAEKAAARAAAAEERLEMHREATDAEKRAGGLPDTLLDAELAKWSRPPR